MIIERLAVFSGALAPAGYTGQTVTGTNTTVLSTDSVDFLRAFDLGAGRDVNVLAQVVQAFGGGTSVDIQIVLADDGALSSNLTVVGASGPIPIAQLTAGRTFNIAAGWRANYRGQRFMGVRYALVGAVVSGSMFAGVIGDVQDGAKFYANGFAVL